MSTQCALTGDIMRSVRIDLKMNQTDFAKQLGISRRQVVAFETGEKLIPVMVGYAIAYIAKNGFKWPWKVYAIIG